MRVDGSAEVGTMEFTVNCPNDGSVEVRLDDIDSIIVRGGSDVEVVFVCPRCGERISLAAQVPHALLAQLDDHWVSVDGDERRMVTMRTVPDTVQEPPGIDAYCEYFRRELAGVGCVEEMLAEIDAHELR